MASVRIKVVCAVVVGLVLAIVGIVFLGRSNEVAAPRPEPHAATTPEPSSSLVPVPVPRLSRSKGQNDWAFFFRAGDTLSRMSDGAPLGVVLRLERSYSFPDGSTGPAYVVRSGDQHEVVFDADELERSARIESIRESGRSRVGTRSR